MGVTVRYRASRERWVVTETNGSDRNQTTFRTEEEAEQFASKRRTEIGDALYHGKMGRKPRYTFADGLMRWIDEYDTSSQASNINNVAEWFGEHAPDAVLGIETLDAARRMQRQLRKAGKSQSTINNRTQVVKRVLSLAFREWDWLDEPLDGKLRKPTPKNARQVFCTVDELRELLSAVPEEYAEEKKIIALAAVTGMRRGEILALDQSNIHGNRIILKPGQTKSGKARVIPLPGDGAALTDSVPFVTTPHRLRKAFEAARIAIGKPGVRFHDLRHSYASMLAEAGEAMTTLRDLLGHSSLIVTSRYAHMFDSRLDQVAGKLPTFRDQTATRSIIAEGLKPVNH
ncbi:site-specific integrase [Salinicola sp. CR57]|uniref:tyrosine-type recombinase/integrase n=1 Tax=Salinicola sp. CR57 TaxID=1949086 RepID=UPI000DA1AF81|nr:site-specific integrase [Salinicola sp. CR57]